MAILNEQTLGDITIYECDTAPTHSATDGSIAIDKEYGIIFMRTNNNWVSVLSNDNGEVASITTPADSWDVTNDTVGSYFIFANEAGWSLSGVGTSDWTIINNYQLQYNGTYPIRVLARGEHTFQTGTGKWANNQLILAINLTVPPVRIENVVSAPVDDIGQHSLTNSVVQAFNIGHGDILSLGRGSLTQEVGVVSPKSKTFHVDKVSLGVQVLDKSQYIGEQLSEDWESGSFATNSWTIVNDTTNQWVAGTADANGGIYSAYISNDSGTSAAYTITTANVSHIYKDISLPAGTELITVEFDWKCIGENAGGDDQYDYGRLFFPRSFINGSDENPVAGTQYTLNQIGQTKYNNQGTWTREKFTIQDQSDNRVPVVNQVTTSPTPTSPNILDYTFTDVGIGDTFLWSGAGTDSMEYVFTSTDPSVYCAEMLTAFNNAGNTQTEAFNNNPVFRIQGLVDNFSWFGSYQVIKVDQFELSNQSRRLIFSWRNDGSAGSNPPFQIDNISVKAYKF